MQKPKQTNFSWFGADYNINLYKGCCHGCIYCDSRSNCYGIKDFDKVRLKADAAKILAGELKTRRQRGIVGIGAMSDTYNPFEESAKVTREALKLIHHYGYGVSLDTKSDLVTRDIDIIQAISHDYGAIVKLTITTADHETAKLIEPHAPAPERRFGAIGRLSDAGIYTGVLFTPILPFITDNEDNIRKIIRLAYEYGAKFVYTSFGVTMRENQREYFFEQLDRFFPGLKQEYVTAFGNNYECIAPDNKRLFQIFKEECNQHGLLYKMNDIIAGYKKKEAYKQLTFDFK